MCNRSFHLLRAALVLHRKLILWMTFGFGILFVLTAEISPAQSPLYWFILFAGGCLITSSSFKELHDPSTSIHYLTLPCSAWQRYFSIWALTGPAYFCLVTALYAVGIFVHVLLHRFWLFGSPWATLYIAGEYLIANAFFLFGAVLLKKLPFLKTFCCLLIVALILRIVSHWAWPLFDEDPVYYSLDSVLAVLAWFGAYRLLKKTELR